MRQYRQCASVIGSRGVGGGGWDFTRQVVVYQLISKYYPMYSTNVMRFVWPLLRVSNRRYALKRGPTVNLGFHMETRDRATWY